MRWKPASSTGSRRTLRTGLGTSAMIFLLHPDVAADDDLRGRDPPLGGRERAVARLRRLFERASFDVPEHPGDPILRGKARQGPIEQRQLDTQLRARAL